MDFGNTKSCLESGNLNVNSADSDSDLFSSPAITDNSAQMKKKDKLSEDFTNVDDSRRTKMNLKRSGKYTTRSKFVLGNTIPENDLHIQDQKISGNPSSRTFNTDSKLASDNCKSSNSTNCNTNIPIINPLLMWALELQV